MKRIVGFVRKFPLSISFGMLMGFALHNSIFSPWLHYQNLPFPPVLVTVKAGDVALLTVERCNTSYKKRTYKTTRRLINVNAAGTGRMDDMILGNKWVDIEPGCHRSVSSLSEIPFKTRPGIWRLSGVAIVPIYVGNFELPWTFEVPWYSEDFKVVEL
jgi:hypothetical protein